MNATFTYEAVLSSITALLSATIDVMLTYYSGSSSTINVTFKHHSGAFKRYSGTFK